MIKQPKENMLEKAGGVIKKGAAYVLLSTFALFSYSHLKAGQIDNAEYKTTSQIDSDANRFGANAKVVGLNSVSQHNKLAHNSDEPIYVLIDESFSSSDIELIQRSLNYFENVFVDINARYRFEIVSKTDYNLKILNNKTTIRYSMKDLTGAIKGKNELTSNLFNLKYTFQSRIFIGKNLSQDPTVRYYVFLHELAHAFGLRDLYQTEKGVNVYYGNSIMQTSSLQKELAILNPNDYKILQALYNDSHLENGAVNEEKLQLIINKIKEYDENFYDVLTQTLSKNLANGSSNFNFEQIITEQINQTKLTHFKTIYNTCIDSAEPDRQYENQIEFINDNYYLKTYLNGQFVFETSGKYFIVNDAIIIPDIYMEYNPSFYISEEVMDTRPTISNLIIVKKDGEYKIITPDTMTMYLTVNNSLENTAFNKNKENNVQNKKVFAQYIKQKETLKKLKAINPSLEQ